MIPEEEENKNIGGELPPNDDETRQSEESIGGELPPDDDE